MDLQQHALLESLATAVAAGIFLTVLSRRLGLPAIILLLAGGVVLGPEGIGLVKPASLEGFLPVVVALAVGLVLFEGGLTLDLRGYRKGSIVIRRLLTGGVVITWLGSSFFVWWLLDVEIPMALLAGSLVIVTGPTVIAPLLKRVKISSRLHDILHWEGVLIDAIGVFVATLCFEWIVIGSGETAVLNLLLRVGSGIGLGIFGGLAIASAYRRRIVPEGQLNAFAIGAAVGLFGLTEAIISEAGLLSVTLAGLVVGWRRPVELERLRQFKAEITDLLIGMLFVLLASRLELDWFRDFGLMGALAVAAVMLIVRPLEVFTASIGSPLAWRERLFLSWVAPRGIVAASMASLFAIQLSHLELPGDPRLLETFTFAVIVATVVIQGLSAGPVAGLLGVRRPDPTGWAIVSADTFSRRIARFIREEAGLEVVILDTNPRLIEEARNEGLVALQDDARNVELSSEREALRRCGHLLALTDNPELNELLCDRWREVLGRGSVHGWSPRAATLEGRHEFSGVAFPGMPRPSVAAAELIDDDARLELVGRPLLSEDMPLLALAPGRAVPIGDLETDVQPDDRILVLRRYSGFLARSLENGTVVDLEVETLEDLAKALVDKVIQLHPGVSTEEALARFAEGDKILGSVLGRGVAIPHIYSPLIARRLCLLARLPQGLEIPDEKKALQLVFLLVSPEGDPSGHLETLAEIARLCTSDKRRQALIDCPDPESARRLLLG